MKVKELIKKLQQLPGDLTININAGDVYLPIKELEVMNRIKKNGTDDRIIILTPDPKQS